MTNAARLNETLSMGQPDRIMTYDYADNSEILTAYGGWSPDEKYSFEEILELNARAHKGVGLDITRAYHDPLNHWMHGKVENWERYLKIVPGSLGVESSGDTSWINRRPFSNSAELEKFMPQMPVLEEIRAGYGPVISSIVETFKAYDRVYIGCVEGPLSDAYTYADMELLSMAIYDAPELVDRLLAVMGEYSRQLALIYAENDTPPLQFMGEDIAGTGGPIFSPVFIEEKCLPLWDKIAAPIRERGGKFIYHTDGRYGELLNLIFGKFDADCLNPIERCGCNDIFDIFERYPDRFYFGNVCCETTLPFGNRWDVEDETLELIEKIGPSKRIFIGSSSEVHEKIPLLNIEVMYGTVHEYGEYPLDIDRIRKRRAELKSKLAVREEGAAKDWK
ncbi:MAG: hypothetical protein JEZ04_11940 [Spirochaetales bacterium]|nr:hypothetical protein [Spirochaetales bacterium]